MNVFKRKKVTYTAVGIQKYNDNFFQGFSGYKQIPLCHCGYEISSYLLFPGNGQYTFKVFVRKNDRSQSCPKINQHKKDTEIYRTLKLKCNRAFRIQDN